MARLPGGNLRPAPILHPRQHSSAPIKLAPASRELKNSERAKAVQSSWALLTANGDAGPPENFRMFPSSVGAIADYKSYNEAVDHANRLGANHSRRFRAR